MIIETNDFKTESLSKINLLLNKESGLYFFYRTRCMYMQSIFDKYINLSGAPVVFLHGNPHVDNYARIGDNVGMVDFDRSRMGPYMWDISRFLSGIILKTEGMSELSARIKQAFEEGYSTRLENVNLGYKGVESVMNQKPEPWQESVEAYLSSGKKWAKKLLKGDVGKDNPLVESLLRKYIKSRHRPDMLDEYDVRSVGAATGTMGNKRFLIHLKAKDPWKGSLLLDAKEVYRDRDTEHFYNPYRLHAHRMIEASKLYASGVEQGLGYAVIKGREFWVREVPSFKAKLKGQLESSTAEELSFHVGCQLGIAHGRSALFCSPGYLNKHYSSSKIEIYETANQMSVDIKEGYSLHIKKLKKYIENLVEASSES